MRRRRCRLCLCWRRRALWWTLGRRRRLRTRCGLVWFRFRTIRFGTVRRGLRGRRTVRFRWRRWTIRLGRGRAVILRRRLDWTIRLRTIWLRRVVRLIWTVVLRLRGGRTVVIFRWRSRAICLRAIACRRIVFRTIDFRAIAWLRSWHWATRLRRGWTIRLCRRGRTLIGSWLSGCRLIGRTIRRLVNGRRSGLSRASSIRLVHGRVSGLSRTSGIRLVTWTAHGRRGRFAGGRLLHHRGRGRGSRRTHTL